jgi:hypothetical protein
MPRPISLAVVCLALVGASTAPGDAAPRGCRALHGKKVLTTPALRVVSVHVDTVYRKNNTRVVGRNFLACARPGGKVRKIGFVYREYATTGSIKGMTPVDSGFTSFGQSAGTFLLVRTREADLAGNFAERTYRVVDVATGHRYSYFHYLQTEEASEPGPAPPVKVVLDATGRLATLLSSPTDQGYSAPPVGRSQVVAYSRTGARVVLDDAPVEAIPAASLGLSDGVVHWTNAGQAKSAPAP